VVVASGGPQPIKASAPVLVHHSPGLNSDVGWQAVLAAREVINATDDKQATHAIYEMSTRAARYSTALGDRLRELYGED
jgi:hypothetical protein